jgi:hypothetical protein
MMTKPKEAEMGDAYTMRGEIRNAYNVSAGKPERKRL